MSDAGGSTKIGLAYSKYIDSLGTNELSQFDYWEVPYELLAFERNVLDTIAPKPIILHCASLSLAGYGQANPETQDKILKFAKATQTPWIGEHLAYISADKIDDKYYESYADGEPYNIGYTVSPVMNAKSVDNVIANLTASEAYLKVPIILENSPLYFSLPASNMSQTEFINCICQNSNAGLLLDLTHLYITSRNFFFDPIKELDKLPLDRVVEVHISGVAHDGISHWDNHANTAPRIIFDLLKHLLKSVSPRAVTLEYNWTNNLSREILLGELTKVREIVNHA